MRDTEEHESGVKVNRIKCILWDDFDSDYCDACERCNELDEFLESLE